MNTQKQNNANHAGSTQEFTEILDIIDDVAVFKGGMAASIIEVQATNFALLSAQEQEVKIASYGSLLNSLSFPIQILVRNKKVDISSYVHLLNEEIEKTNTPHQSLSKEQNNQLLQYIRQYKDFVQELVKINVVLDKKFYMVVYFSPLEAGAQGAKYMLKGKIDPKNIYNTSKLNLHSKTDSLLTQLSRLSLRAKVLSENELVTLFYSFYNEGQNESQDITLSVKAPIIKGVQK